MTAVLVDSNVILDIFSDDPVWLEWSADAIERAAELGPLVINPMIYAEISMRFTSIEDLEARLGATPVQREDIPFEAAFLAAKVYRSYRSRGGRRPSVLPDFFIGAHAAVRRFALLTRDVRRYRSYFPTLDLIAPD